MPFFTPETIEEEPVFIKMPVLTTLIVEIPTTFENGELNISGYFNDFNFRLKDSRGNDYVDLDILIVSQWQDPLDPISASLVSSASATLERFSFDSSASASNQDNYGSGMTIHWNADAHKFSYNAIITGTATPCFEENGDTDAGGEYRGLFGSYYGSFDLYYSKEINACNVSESGKSSSSIIGESGIFEVSDFAISILYSFPPSLWGSASGSFSISITDLQLSYKRQVIKSWVYTDTTTGRWVAWFKVTEKKSRNYGSIPNKTYLIGFYGRSKSVQKVKIFARSGWIPTTLSLSLQYLSINEAFTKYAYTEYDYEKDVLSENINSLNFNLDTIVVEDFFSNELSGQLTFD